MAKLLSLAALAAGIWLLTIGYQRQHSLAGSADATLAKIGQSIDGGDHTPTHVKYYIGGAVLVLGGAFGLGLVRK